MRKAQILAAVMVGAALWCAMAAADVPAGQELPAAAATPAPGAGEPAVPAPADAAVPGAAPASAPAETPPKVEPPAPQPAVAAEEELPPRDPFWPVGWYPNRPGQEEPTNEVAAVEEPVVKEEPPKWDDAVKKLQIKGVMKTPTGYVAMIGGQIVKESETVSVLYEAKLYRWKVRSITSRGVRFEPLDAGPPTAM